MRRTVRLTLALLLPALLLLAGSPAVPVAAADPALRDPAVLLDRALVVQGAPSAGAFQPGEDATVTGTLMAVEGDPLAGGTVVTTAGAFRAELVRADGTATDLGTVTTLPDGSFTVTVPGEVTAAIAPGPRTGFREVAALRFRDATGAGRSAAYAGEVPVTFAQEAGLQLTNRFVSFTGWVKPGESFPLQVELDNFDPAPATGATVTLSPAPGATLLEGTALDGNGTAAVNADGTLTWTVSEVAAAGEEGPGTAVLIVTARAASFAEDERIVWKDLSMDAVLIGGQTSTSHGPKVIPASGGFETARYGDRIFPMVPVEYLDRGRQAESTAEALETAVNDPAFEGSAFNLYQEMSYGQLFPEGTVPSLGIASATFSEYEPGFDFSTPDLSTGTCRGQTLASTDAAIGSPVFDTRIVDGWYQLPGNTEYYGGDFPAFTLGVGSSIDSACGPLGKGVFDAAQISDPEIDYNDYDADKDGVVDFFMLVYNGCGGNGASQVTVAFCPYTEAPYDNIWPHSADLQAQFRDDATGLRGYVSDDQLVDLNGVPQCWTDDTYTERDACAAAGGSGDDAIPTFVRVGPYNVNPETAIASASVISHEFGHYLGLSDFYSSYAAYGTYNLMAADYSQHMTIYAKQELGWVVPEFLQPGETREVTDWSEVKTNTGEIHWETPSGEAYTLSESNGDRNVNNGQAFALQLPPRQTLDPASVAGELSEPTVFWSGRGNDFGCSPDGARNLDVFLPELADLPEGTPVNVSFNSSWDIEWDFDYGFVLVSTDGQNYESLPSENGYTTPPELDPNRSECFQQQGGNGITGQSGAYEQGEAAVVAGRNPAENDYSFGSPFLADSYDLSAFAGQENVVLRFSYHTDPAVSRAGWFIDDLNVTAGEEVVYSSDFESGDEAGRIFPGGCDADGFNVALICTDGWGQVQIGEDAETDHAYYLELRDRNGFDFDGHGQSDRGDILFEPGILLEYADEAHGIGNNGVPLPPGQHYLDPDPVPGDECPENETCADWSFTTAEERSRFSDVGLIQSFSDPANEPVETGETDELGQPITVRPWLFDYGCLDLQVTGLDGAEVTDGALPGDLSADATITAGDGCQEFGYGLSGVSDTVRRVSGPDRVATAVELSRDSFPGTAPAAVLATAGAFPDALAASALAAEVSGPILLTGSDELDPRVGEELTRLGATRVFLAGGTAALSLAVEQELADRRIDVVRLGGADRYETAALVADEVVELGGAVGNVTVALGDAFPDALAAGNLATTARVPILLTRAGDLPAATAAALERLAPVSVFIAGGTAAISSEVESELAAGGGSVERLAGANRFGTAVAIAERAVALGATRNPVYLASGADFPDALAAAPAAGRAGGILLLVDPDALSASPETATYLTANAAEVDEVVIAGGPAAVADGVLGEVATAIPG